MKKPSDEKKYETRSKHFEVLGTYSEKDILKRIRSGKFSGEEEVREIHQTEWQKLASHPKFYDAFLKRLYGTDYHSPEVTAEPEKKAAPQGTQIGEPPDLKTRQLNEATSLLVDDVLLEPKEGAKKPPSKLLLSGKTIHQSEIEELFSKSKSPNEEAQQEEPKSEQSNSQHTAMKAPDASPLADPGHVADFSDKPLHPLELPGPNPKVETPPNRKKMVVWLAAATVGVLVLSWWISSSSIETPVANNEKLEELIKAAAAPFDQAKSITDQADEMIRNDTELFYKGASQLLFEAQQLDPDNDKILSRLALVNAHLLHTETNLSEAKKKIKNWIQRARKVDPHSSNLYRTESWVALDLGQLDKSEHALVSALETDANSAENFALGGELQYLKGNYAESKAALEESIKNDPGNVRAHYFLSLALIQLSDLAGAQEEAIQALKLNPLHPRSYFVLARIAAASGKEEEAIALFESCARLVKFVTPDVAAQAHLEAGFILEKQNRQGEARQHYRQAYHYDSRVFKDHKNKLRGLSLDKKELELMAMEYEYKSPYFLEQGEGLIKSRKFREAIRFYQAAYLLSGNNPKFLVELAKATERTAGSYEDFRRIQQYYQKAIRKAPEVAEGYLQLGLLETEQYNFEQALKLLRQGLEIDPDSAAAHIALGKYYFQKQDVDRASEEFLKALEIDRSNSESYYYAGLLLLKFKKGIKEAEKYFYNAYISNPVNMDALAAWLRLKAQSNDRTFAIKFLNNLLENDRDNSDLNWAMGEVYAASSEYRRAIQYYHRSLDLDNRNSRARMSLAAALDAIGETDKAIAEYRMAALLDRRKAEGFYRAAELLVSLRKYNQAEEVVNFLIGLAPAYPGAHKMLSQIHLEKKQESKAIAEMEKEVENNPQNYRFVLELSELYMSFDKYDEAVKELTKITNLPKLKDHPEFRYEKIRGYLLLARTYRLQNKLEGAEGTIKLAIELDPSDPELQRELGYVYYAQQRDKEGAEVFEKYLKQNPNARDTAAIKSLLQKMKID